MKRMASPYPPSPIDTMGYFDNRMIARMRLILATSGLLIIKIDPAEPDRFVAITYATLALYTVYSSLQQFSIRELIQVEDDRETPYVDRAPP